MTQALHWEADDPDRLVSLDEGLIGVTEVDAWRYCLFQDETGTSWYLERHRITDHGSAATSPTPRRVASPTKRTREPSSPPSAETGKVLASHRVTNTPPTSPS